MSNTSEEYNGTSSSSEKELREGTAAHFLDVHGLILRDEYAKSRDRDDTNPTLTMEQNIATDLNKYEVHLRATLDEARNVELSDVQSPEARAACDALSDFSAALTDAEEFLNVKSHVLAKCLTKWLDVSRRAAEEKAIIARAKAMKEREQKKKRKTQE